MGRFINISRGLAVGVSVFLLLTKGVFAQSLSAPVGGVSATPTNPGLQSAFWNPAVVGLLDNKVNIEGQLGVLGGWLIFDRAGIDPNTQTNYASSKTSAMGPQIFFALSSPLKTKRFRFSYATYFPGGLMAEFDERGSQRYDLIQGMMVPWHHQFTAAMKINPKLSFAAAGIFSAAIFETEIDVDLGKLMQSMLKQEDALMEHPALSARAHVPKTMTTAFGAIAGVHYKPSPHWSMGLSATSPIRYDFKGSFELRPPSFASVLGPALPALGLEDPMEASLRATSYLPACIQTGVRYQPKGYWSQDYYGRYIFSSFVKSLSLSIEDSAVEALKTVNVPGQNLKDAFLVGTNQTFSVSKNLKIGAMASFYKNAVSDDKMAVSRSDFDTVNLGGHMRYSFANRWTLGFEYAHSFVRTRDIQTNVRTQSSSALFEPPDGSGKYRAALDRASLVVSFVP
jgi:long-subunit fatty acid transport protein